MNPRCGVLVLFGLVGCVTTKSIHPRELTRLDGYQGWSTASGTAPEIQTLEGERLKVQSNAFLFLEGPGAHIGGRFKSIAVHDGVFDGRTVEGRRVQVPIDQLTRAEVRQPNERVFAGVAGGVIVGTLLVLLGSYLFVHYAHPLEIN